MKKYIDKEMVKIIMFYNKEDYFVNKNVMLKKSDTVMKKIHDVIMKSDFHIEEGYISKDNMIMFFRTKFQYGNKVRDRKKITLLLEYSRYSDKFRFHSLYGEEFEEDPPCEDDNGDNLLQIMKSELKYGEWWFDLDYDDKGKYYTRHYYCEINKFSNKIDSLDKILTDVSNTLRICYPFLDEEPYFNDEIKSIWEDFKESNSNIIPLIRTRPRKIDILDR